MVAAIHGNHADQGARRAVGEQKEPCCRWHARGNSSAIHSNARHLARPSP